MCWQICFQYLIYYKHFKSLRRASINDRVSAIEKWTAVADICRCLHNFNGVLQVCAAFTNAAVYRLKKTWDKVSKPVSWNDPILDLADCKSLSSIYINLIPTINVFYVTPIKAIELNSTKHSGSCICGSACWFNVLARLQLTMCYEKAHKSYCIFCVLESCHACLTYRPAALDVSRAHYSVEHINPTIYVKCETPFVYSISRSRSPYNPACTFSTRAFRPGTDKFVQKVN